MVTYSNKEKVVELYLGGLSTRQIGEALSISGSWVGAIVKRAGISRSQSTAAQLRQPQLSTHWRTSRQNARNKYQRFHKVKLPSIIEIHHIDGDHTNNAIENLAALPKSEHLKLRHRHWRPEGMLVRHRDGWVPRHLRPARKAYMKAYLKAYYEAHKKQVVNAS